MSFTNKDREYIYQKKLRLHTMMDNDFPAAWRVECTAGNIIVAGPLLKGFIGNKDQHEPTEQALFILDCENNQKWEGFKNENSSLTEWHTISWETYMNNNLTWKGTHYPNRTKIARIGTSQADEDGLLKIKFGMGFYPYCNNQNRHIIYGSKHATREEFMKGISQLSDDDFGCLQVSYTMGRLYMNHDTYADAKKKQAPMEKYI